MALMEAMRNRLPVGPGSRGGNWHDPEYRRAYWRRWRAAHPEYRERESRRRLLQHAEARLTTGQCWRHRGSERECY
jgi:hypothetical protein